MSDLLTRLERAKAELEQAEREIAQASCAEVGHRWNFVGGRNAGCELIGCDCSVPVYECATCGDCDYGHNAEAAEALRVCTEKMILEDQDYEPRACTVCGATTSSEAGKLCRSYQIPSGDYTCDGHPEEESYPDGRLRFLSPAGIERINAWVEEQVAADRENGQA
ncbi:hypothetical protein [Mesorhizobium sp.]|uniref:hypothetical protein n=1 Tax=Mesorhizobium sp. TaxID=1871066 RepID=UPI000FE9E260|nr:hypothetical protein [Mesorhizobium sp.]RWB67611.1 MAG: hypothetical protein EOQ49_25155 [Mesorhizobium sp.]